MNSSTSTIKIIDAFMGSGKTTYIFQDITRRIFSDGARFLYVSPFLAEVGNPDYKNKNIEKQEEMRKGRIHRECGVADFKSPTSSPTKAKSLKRLLSLGENVACTHKLFEDMDEEIAELIKEQEYELIIDEALNVVQPYPYGKLKKGDMKYIKQSIWVNNETHQVEWHDLDTDQSSFDNFKQLCLEGRLYNYKGDFYIWELPPAILTAAKQVTICTYLFKASILHSYFIKHSIPFEYIDNESIGLKPEHEMLQEAKQLIEIVDNPYVHKLGSKSMTATGYNSLKPSDFKQIRGWIEMLNQRYLKVKSSELIWTCFKSQQKLIEGAGYKRSFLSMNARATNDYADRRVGIYLVNRYPNSPIKTFLGWSGTTIEDDLYGLSEMVQWIWRLRIRNGEPIQLVIPSKRMRELLERWLDGEFMLTVNINIKKAA